MIFILAFLFLGCDAIISNVHIYRGSINNSTEINVSRYDESIIFYEYEAITGHDMVLQLNVNAYFTSTEYLFVVLKNEFDIVNSFKLSNIKVGQWINSSRVVCPISLIDSNRSISVEVSSKSKEIINTYVSLTPINDFYLTLNTTQSVKINYYTPKVFNFQFPISTNQVTVSVESKESEVCMMFSVQRNQCPFHDSVSNVRYIGTYQTVTTSGTITVERQQYGSTSSNGFFLVFVVDEDDKICMRNNMYHLNKPNSTSDREKQFNISISKVAESSYYVLPIFGAICFYLLFYIGAIFISVIYRRCAAKSVIDIPIVDEEENKPVTQLRDPSNYGTVEEVADMRTLYSRFNRSANYHQFEDDIIESSSNASQTPAFSEDSYDSLSDASSDPNVYRLNKKLFVSNLAKKHPALLNRKYFLYLWYLIIISVFYALPVVQLVLTYQKVVRDTGNEDMCFYNFRCTRPLFVFSAFNNVISNIGYVLLGILFIFITYRRDRLYNEYRRYRAGIINKGIPQYNGLFYAMGMALTMEGILSACYHICPSNNNFQFDTAFMYILGCLCMIKVYQMRHPDVNATAHSFFMCMAMIIFVGVIGVTYNSKPFWIVFTFLYVVLSIVVSLEIYYVGRWRFTLSFPQRIYHRLLIDKWRCLIPAYRHRFIIIIVNYCLNFGIALYGGIMSPNNFASYFLAIFMFNLMLYFAFYVFMKIHHCEHFSILSIIYILIAAFCWGFALYCFIKHPTDWQLTPAKSRELNTPCIFLSFYDIHDVWHFLSSMSMFFSFLALQTLDDNMFDLDRNLIPVF